MRLTLDLRRCPQEKAGQRERPVDGWRGPGRRLRAKCPGRTPQATRVVPSARPSAVPQASARLVVRTAGVMGWEIILARSLRCRGERAPKEPFG